MPEFSRRTVLRAAAASPLLAAAQAPAERRMLSGDWNAARLGAALLPRGQWKPYPKASERAAWAKMPAVARAAGVRRAEEVANEPWPSLPATLFLEFKREGNRSRFESVRSERRNRIRALALAECFEGNGRFLDPLLDGLWLTCEETYWGVPAHLYLQGAGPGLPDVAEPTVDLFAADTGSLVAWVDYLLGEELGALSPLVRPRLAGEVRRRVLEPCWSREDFWWMGFDGSRAVNNWNPWINSNWLTCALLLEENEGRRAATVAKVLRSLDRFLDAYHPDGGCDEGPGYWGHAGGSMFECLDLLHSATIGRADFFETPLVKEIGRYIYRAHIHEDWYVNFADASARTIIDGDLVYRFGKRIGDARMMEHGAWAVQRAPERALAGSSIARQLEAMVHHGEEMKSPAGAALMRDVWLPQAQFFAARMKGGSADGLYLAAQGGHNAESHNHNDVGNFIVYADGAPVLIDIGVETYTARTFSPQRYDIWTMQSGWHNLPTVNGVMQGAGRRFEARECRYTTEEAGASLSMEIARAWPEVAGVESWQRRFRLDRQSGEVVVEDTARFARAANRVEFNLVTTREVVRDGAGILRLVGGGTAAVELRFAHTLEVQVDVETTEDARLKPVWGSTIRRIRLLAAKADQAGEWRLRVRLAG
ncbi:MAG TPA: heparinase II/III family protein [Bryobacteraceae bacterium]|nr:heparinase II/III family protein [Bryobacteraceae bacterium]